MSMFTFAISSLTPSNLPWSMGVTFQVPMRYCFFIASDFIFTMDTSTIECHFCYGPVTSFFLELLAPLSPVAYWTLCNPGRVGGGGGSCLFAFSYWYWGSWGKNTGVGFHFLPQWTTFCQSSLLWLVVLGGPAQYDLQLHWVIKVLHHKKDMTHEELY